MNDFPTHRLRAIAARAAGTLAVAVGVSATAQTSTAPSGPSAPSTGAPSSSSAPFGVQSEQGPYYIGINQALTHDSNVFRVPSGPSDNFSSTSLLAGFSQPISRQRVFGSATVSANRYQRQDELNNTSYSLAAGIDWETIQNLSGNLSTALARSLSAPTATAGTPTATRNLVQTRSVDATARWGGVSLLTLEGTGGWSNVDYSAPESAQSESSQQRGGLTLFYGPGGPLRLGVGGHVLRTRSPQGLFDPATGTFQETTVTSKSADILVEYRLTGLLSTNGRLSYTKQSSANAGSGDFSGLTGSLSVNWRPTGKMSVGLDAGRDAGFDASSYSTLQIVNNNGVLTLAPVTGLYENNRVSQWIGLGATHATTAKINLGVNGRYTRAKLATSGVVGSTGPETVDVAKVLSLSGNYEITRYWSLGCNLSHEWRDVSGGSSFSYKAHVVSCSTQLTLR